VLVFDIFINEPSTLINFEFYKMKKSLLPLLIILTQILYAQDTVKVFYFGGQSNMDGYGYTKDLPNSLTNSFSNVWIFHGNPVGDEQENGGIGIWEALRPGHGVGFKSDGKTNKLSNRFGLELSFAKMMVEQYPNQKIALIKYSRGGSSIDSLAAGNFGSWEPDYTGKNGMNQYDFFLKTLNNAFAHEDIDKDGQKDILVPQGILWMQGESDAAFTEEIASNYYDALKRLMDLMRAALRVDDLPIVIGKISDSWNDTDGKIWTHGDLVEYAQEKFAMKDSKTEIVRNTRYYKYSDKWHYDSQGYIDLGEKFAEAMLKLMDE